MFSFASPICFLRQLTCPLPFFSIPSIAQLNGANIFWTSLVSLKRITVYNQPKECTKFFKGKSKQKSTNTLHQVWFCLPSIWAVKWIPIKSSLHFLPAHPAPILPLSSSYKRSRRLASQWSIAWRVLVAYTHNLRNKMGGKKYPPKCHEKQSEKLFHPTPAKLIIFWLLIQRNSLRNCVKPLCKSCEKLKPPVFLSEKRTTAINRMATWSIFNREKLWIHCLNTSRQPREIWRILLQTFSNSESYQTWALGQ